ncbi:MAG: nuclear transport factor 2 family protein [Candidatus Bathyarchaeota archaeon]|nr:nuclear transport factor 2 family protein [Candidatus Bathyarchaeota archaeon]
MDSFDVMMVALNFNVKINERDIDGLVALMTADHTFIDIPGEVHKGKDVMRKGWREFFKKFPDYRNVFTRVIVSNNIVVILGHSTCSYNQLDGSSIWTAKVHDGRVSEWRVYEDTASNRQKLGIAK